MIVFRRLQDARPGQRGRAVAIGSFDGLHRGHRAVLARLLQSARQRRLEPLVLTFEPTPRQYFAPSPVSRLRLTPDRERLDLLAEYGVRATVVLPFDERLREISPADFCADVLRTALGAQHVLMGESHTIGRGGAGTLERVRELGTSLGFTVQAVPDVRAALRQAQDRPRCPGGHPEPRRRAGKQIVSSSAVRQALVQGDARQAAALLGRRYALHGMVVEGRRRGGTLQLPTANLRLPSEKLLHAVGIYAAFLSGPPFASPRPAAVNVGPAPTFDVEDLIVEAHIPGFAGSLYGQPLGLWLEERIRQVVKFDTVEELKHQIGCDVERTLQICATAEA